MSKETNVHVSDCTINHCIPQMNSQWSTAEGIMVLGTTLTFITMYSKLLQVQYGCRVVYFGEWDANGDYIDMYQDTCGPLQNVGWSRELLWHTSQGTVN